MNSISMQPIGYVISPRKDLGDDLWGGVVSEIIINLGEEALQGIEDFSHAEVIFYFHKSSETTIVRGARHPRNNPAWPKVGILAQRGRNRPNRIGLTVVKIIRCQKNVLYVTGLDALDGTPVLDIKPVMQEFLPREPVRQPHWSTELMKSYWFESEDE